MNSVDSPDRFEESLNSRDPEFAIQQTRHSLQKARDVDSARAFHHFGHGMKQTPRRLEGRRSAGRSLYGAGAKAIAPGAGG